MTHLYSALIHNKYLFFNSGIINTVRPATCMGDQDGVLDMAAFKNEICVIFFGEIKDLEEDFKAFFSDD